MTEKEQTIKQKAWGVGFRMGATTDFVYEVDRIDGTIKPRIIGITDKKLFEILPNLKRGEEEIFREFEKGKTAGRLFARTLHTPDTSKPLRQGALNRIIIYGTIKY